MQNKMAKKVSKIANFFILAGTLIMVCAVVYVGLEYLIWVWYGQTIGLPLDVLFQLVATLIAGMIFSYAAKIFNSGMKSLRKNLNA
jgi:hypothetical protein